MQTIKISTRTIMVYFNLEYHIEKISKQRDKLINLENVTYKLTKKSKQIDKKTIRGPSGQIFCTEYRNDVVGLPIKRKKKKSTSRIDYFLNQISFDLSLGDYNINIMMFKNSFKISGCKEDEDAIKGVEILWKTLDKFIPEFYTISNNDKPSFTFEIVMMNTGFNFKKYIDRENLNQIMNRPEHNDKVLISQYVPTLHTNVNIKMVSDKPENYKYKKVTIDKEFIVENIDSVLFKKDKPKQKVDKDTFIVFSSGQVILSGKYLSSMMENYKMFSSILNKELFKN